MKVIALNTIHRTIEPGKEGDKNKGTAPVKPKIQIITAGEAFESSGEELQQLKDAGSIRKWTPKTAAGERKINALLTDPVEGDDDDWEDDDDNTVNEGIEADGTTKQPQWDEAKHREMAAKALKDAREEEAKQAKIDADNAAANDANKNLGEGTGQSAGDGTAAAAPVSSTAAKATKASASAAAVKATKVNDGSDLV